MLSERNDRKVRIKCHGSESRGEKTMDELSRRRLQQVDRFITSLTPEQQALLKVGALMGASDDSLSKEFGRSD
jgi:hypothetical protein